MRIRRFMKARTILIVVPLALLMYIYSSQTWKDSAKDATHKTIEQMHSLAPAPGYTLGEIGIQGGPAPFPKTGKTFTARKTSSSSIAKECKAFIAYARQLGTSSLSDETPSKSSPNEHLQITCVATLSGLSAIDDVRVSSTFNLYGFVQHENGKSTLKVDLNRETITPVNKRSNFTYNANISAYYGEIDLDPNTETGTPADERLTILDLIGNYRVTHPQADPYDPAIIDGILKKFRASESKISVKNIADASGQVTRLHVRPTGGYLPFCMSVRKFNPAYFGTPDPGRYYAIGYGEKLSDDAEYGASATGDCPTN